MQPLPILLAATLLGTTVGGSIEEQPIESSRQAPRRYVIEQIRLEGLRGTRPSEVRRHLGMSEGELLDEPVVLLSRLRLLQLGWFSRVETRVERGSARGMVVLVFDFAERNTLLVSDLAFGSTPPVPAYAGLGLTQLNFLGLGLGLSGAFVYGDEDHASVRGSFFHPELPVLGARLVFSLSALYLRGEEFACLDPSCTSLAKGNEPVPRLLYDRTGGEVTVGFRPGPFERFLLGYRFERIGADAAVPGQAAPGTTGELPVLRLGRSALSAFTATYERDTRSDFFFPADGSRFTASVTFASPVAGSDYEYSRYLLQLEKDLLLPNGHALRLLGAGGAVQGDAPFFERFFQADFAYFSVGAAQARALEVNFTADPRYDAYLGMLGAEYAIPLWSAGSFFHRGYLAIGARWLFTSARAKAGRTRVSSTPFSGDIALRLDTPVGSFNVSTAYAMDNLI